jgi:hypothetical protein
VQCPEESTKDVSKATDHTKKMRISSNYRKLDIILKNWRGGEALPQKCTHKESKNAKKNREESIRQLLRLQTKSHLSSKTLIRKLVDSKRKISFVREKRGGEKKRNMKAYLFVT